MSDKSTPAIKVKDGNKTTWKCGKKAGKKPVEKGNKKPVEQEKKPGGNDK